MDFVDQLVNTIPRNIFRRSRSRMRKPATKPNGMAAAHHANVLLRYVFRSSRSRMQGGWGGETPPKTSSGRPENLATCNSPLVSADTSVCLLHLIVFQDSQLCCETRYLSTLMSLPTRPCVKRMAILFPLFGPNSKGHNRNGSAGHPPQVDGRHLLFGPKLFLGPSYKE